MTFVIGNDTLHAHYTAECCGLAHGGYRPLTDETYEMAIGCSDQVYYISDHANLTDNLRRVIHQRGAQVVMVAT